MPRVVPDPTKLRSEGTQTVTGTAPEAVLIGQCLRSDFSVANSRGLPQAQFYAITAAVNAGESVTTIRLEQGRLFPGVALLPNWHHALDFDGFLIPYTELTPLDNVIPVGISNDGGEYIELDGALQTDDTFGLPTDADQGGWNASTNTPDINAGAPYATISYWIVTVEGTQTFGPFVNRLFKVDEYVVYDPNKAEPWVHIQNPSTPGNSFIQLDDTPSSFSGETDKVVVVDSSETRVRFSSSDTLDGKPPNIVLPTSSPVSVALNDFVIFDPDDPAGPWTLTAPSVSSADDGKGFRLLASTFGDATVTLNAQDSTLFSDPEIPGSPLASITATLTGTGLGFVYDSSNDQWRLPQVKAVEENFALLAGSPTNFAPTDYPIGAWNSVAGWDEAIHTPLFAVDTVPNRTTGVITLPRAGRYSVRGNLLFDQGNGSQNLSIRMWLRRDTGGGPTDAICASMQVAHNQTDERQLNAEVVIDGAAGEELELGLSYVNNSIGTIDFASFTSNFEIRYIPATRLTVDP